MSEPVDFDLGGVVGLRLIDAGPREASAVTVSGEAPTDGVTLRTAAGPSWQVVVPESVKAPPASGTNCQS